VNILGRDDDYLCAGERKGKRTEAKTKTVTRAVRRGGDSCKGNIRQVRRGGTTGTKGTSH
jgi:hypothetical protein